MSKIKVVVIMLIFTALSFALGGRALATSLMVDVHCPARVKPGSALWATVDAHNRTNSPVTVSKALVGLAAHASEALSGLSLYGPFSKSLGFQIPPLGNGQTQTISVVDSVPDRLVNKVAIVSVMFTTADYKTNLGNGICLVEVK